MGNNKNKKTSKKNKQKIIERKKLIPHKGKRTKMIEMDLLHKVLQFIFQPVMNYNQQKKTKIKDMITCRKWISIWTYRFKKQQFSQTFTLFFFFENTDIQKRKTYKRRRTRIKIDNGVIRNYNKKRYRSIEYII